MKKNEKKPWTPHPRCGSCFCLFATDADLSRHYNRTHNRRAEFVREEKGLSSRRSVSRGRDSREDGLQRSVSRGRGRNECLTCGREFTYRKSYDDHLKKCKGRNPNKGSFACENCEKRFAYVRAYQKHR